SIILAFLALISPDPEPSYLIHPLKNDCSQVRMPTPSTVVLESAELQRTCSRNYLPKQTLWIRLTHSTRPLWRGNFSAQKEKPEKLEKYLRWDCRNSHPKR